MGHYDGWLLARDNTDEMIREPFNLGGEIIQFGAVKHKQRIPNKVLIGLAVLGGSTVPEDILRLWNNRKYWQRR